MTETTITVSRTVAADPEWVFGAWIDADVLARWWWLQLPGTTYDVDARVGGGYRIEGPAIGVTVTGSYREVDPPRRPGTPGRPRGRGPAGQSMSSRS